MRNAALALMLVSMIAVPCFCFGQWTQLPGPQGGEVNCIAWVGQQIWAGTDNGIYTSVDSGQTWQHSVIIAGKTCTAIIPFSGDTVVVSYHLFPNYDLIVNFSSTFTDTLYTILSVDGGINWSSPSVADHGGWLLIPNITRAQHSLTFNDQFGTGANVSFDYGGTWSAMAPAIENSPPDNLIADTNYVLGTFLDVNLWHDYLLISTDGLRTWQLIDSGYDNTYVDLTSNAIINDSVILLLSGDSLFNYRIRRSTNLGQTWATVYSSSSSNLKALYQFDGKYYCREVSGQQGLVSSDGITWTSGLLPKNDLMGKYNVRISTSGFAQARGNGIDIYSSVSDTFRPSNTGIAAVAINQLAKNSNTLFAAGNDMYCTHDGGLSWSSAGFHLYGVSGILVTGDSIFALNGITTQKAYVIRSLNNGQTWDTTSLHLTQAGVSTGLATPVIYNSRLLMVDGTIWNSHDYGATWDTLPSVPGITANSSSARLVVTGADLICVTATLTVFKFNNTTSQWDSISHLSGIASLTDMRNLITVDSLVVCIGTNAMVISADHGVTWGFKSLTGLPIDYTSGMNIVAPSDIISYNGVWVGNVFSSNIGVSGIYTSADQGNTWSPFLSQNFQFIPNCISLFNGQVYVGSLGASVWRSGSINTVSGNVFHDKNHNGLRDAGEPGLGNAVLEALPTGFYANTDTSGNYTLLTNVIADTLKPVVPSPYGLSTPQSYVISGSATNLNFAYYLPPNIADLKIELTSVTPIRSFFQSNLVLTVTNKGSLTQTPVATLVIDPNVTYVSASPVPSLITGDTLVWNLGSLSFLQGENVVITVTNSTLTGTPVIFYAQVTPVVNDTFPADNFATLNDTLVSSFDPNGKQCSQGNYITPLQIEQGTPIDYTIRFQNTGTASALNIKISDTLSRKVDPGTLEVLASSHPVRWDLSGTGSINFYFDNISLPAASQDELNSHGFVKYRIKCRQSDVLGNSITNTGYIYFDANAAIVTNTTNTVVTNFVVTANTALSGIKINVFPNPASQLLYLDLSRLPDSKLTINLYNEMGSLVETQPGTNAIQNIDIFQFAAGVYFGKIMNSDSKTQQIFRFFISR